MKGVNLVWGEEVRGPVTPEGLGQIPRRWPNLQPALGQGLSRHDGELESI